MSWFTFRARVNRDIQEGERVTWKDIDNDETTEHIIESENIETFQDEQVDSDEGEKE